MYQNIDLALPKIERQILKQSQKRKDKFQKDAFDVKDYLFLEEKPVEEKKDIYKKKSFDLSPITVEDAKEFMEALDHKFYVFLNAETGLVNILYTRADGELGLIECNY